VGAPVKGSEEGRWRRLLQTLARAGGVGANVEGRESSTLKGTGHAAVGRSGFGLCSGLAWSRIQSCCNTPATPWHGPVTPGSSLGSLDCPHRPTLVFSVHFVLTRVHPGKTSRSVTHHQIALGQARLTWSSFQMSFWKRSCNLLI
jgi:hypothetical protein